MALCGICKTSEVPNNTTVVLQPMIKTNEKVDTIQAVAEQAIGNEQSSTKNAIVLVGDTSEKVDAQASTTAPSQPILNKDVTTPEPTTIIASADEPDAFISIPLEPKKPSIIETLKSHITKENLKSSALAMVKAPINGTKKTVSIINEHKIGAALLTATAISLAFAAHKVHEYVTYVAPEVIQDKIPEVIDTSYSLITKIGMGLGVTLSFVSLSLTTLALCTVGVEINTKQKD